MKKNSLAMFFATVLVLCLFGIPAAGTAAGTQIPSEYNVILQTYHTLINDSMYARISAQELLNMGACPLLAEFSSEEKKNFGYYLEDINGDGAPELFLGIDNNEYNDTVYQLYTIFAGQVCCLYTSSDGNGLYLLNDGLLEYETWDLDGEGYAMCLYRFGKDGYMTVTDGVLYDESARKGPYFSISDDSFKATSGKPISESRFNDKVDSFAMKEKYVRYEPLANWYRTASSQTVIGGQQKSDTSSNRTGSSGQQNNSNTTGQKTNTNINTNTDDPSLYFYNHETLTDRTYGVRVAEVLVPKGWRSSLYVNWDFVDTKTPGVATVTLTSPDGKAKIDLVSSQQFYDISTTNITRSSEGPDISLYLTRLKYRDASEVQNLWLQSSDYKNAKLVQSYQISNETVQLLKDAGQMTLQQMVKSTGGTGISSDGSVAYNLYKDGNKYIEYYSCVYAARIYANTGHVAMDQISWNIPISAIFIADSKEIHDKYKSVFNNVFMYSSFTNEFIYVIQQYGDIIAALVTNNLLEKSREFLQAGSSSWASDYERMNGYDSDKFMDKWSDVIKDQNEYTTLDGETYKISTYFDTVYQNGDQLYLGPEGQSPYGWTRLYPN